MAATLTFGELRKGASTWVRSDLKRSLRVGAIAFAVSWVVNFVVITTWGASLGNLLGGATDGTELSGSIYIAVMSLTVSSLVVYGMEAGWSDLRRSFLAVPAAVGRMFREHGVRMWSIVFWGGAVTLLTSGILDPTLSAVFGLGFLAFAPTAVTGMLGRLITGVWTWLIGFFAPRNKPRPPGLGGQLVGVVGAGVGFLVASQATETAFQVIAALALVALSYFVLMNTPSKAGTTAAFILLGLAFWVAGEGIARAFQGCCGEAHHHPLDPGMKAATLSAAAGLAGGVAGMIGAGVGAVLAAHPQNPATWTDSSGEGPTITGDPIPDGPTRTTTITLEGDEARAALDAWRRANAEGGQVDLALPEDEQWEISASDAEGNTARSGHLGTRGRVTGIGGIVEAEDGSIAISVDVTAYNPPVTAPASGVAGSGVTTAPPAPSAGVSAGIDAAAGDAADDAPPPPPPDDTTPPAEPEPTVPGVPVPDVAEVIEDTAVPPRKTPPQGSIPDGSDPGAYADWVGKTATGTLPPPDGEALGGLIRGDRNEATLTGRFTGKWAPLLGSTESRTDGVAVKFPTGDRILVRVQDGRLQVRHEASIFSVFADAVADNAAATGVRLPKIETAIEAVSGPLDGFNRAMDTTGRRVEAVIRNPDGSITIRTR
ncbi:MAG: hypothetical protein HZA58_01105 [Acidimicrobiia bacterium]|nr:hypothetical protein [Acidimicrobiia bacterium]